MWIKRSFRLEVDTTRAKQDDKEEPDLEVKRNMAQMLVSTKLK